MANPISTDPEQKTKSRIGWLSSRVALLHKALPVRQRAASGLEQGALSAVAAIVAYVPAQALGMQEGFWGAITAIAVLQTEFAATRTIARDQFTGAAIGGLLALGVVLTLGESLPAYGCAVFLSLLACWLLNVASAARLAGVTATIILLVPHTGTPMRMFASRLSEVGWGLCVAIAIVWLTGRFKTVFGGEG